MINIAIVQSGPEYWNLSKSLAKASDIISDAARKGAHIIAFGECWLTGYPAWIDYAPEAGLWDHPPVKEAWAQMYENSIEIPGAELKQIQQLAKQYAVHIVLGANEVVKKGKGNGTIYNVVLQIDSSGNMVSHHRKLMPTYTERLIHGLGDGRGLTAVDSDHGRIGSLICWEHWMPLARQAMHDSGEDIHFALWPMVKEMNQVASRHYAFEGACHVVAVGQMMKVSDTPQDIILPHALAQDPTKYVLKGGSCVVGPDGSWILEPQYGLDEVIHVALPSLRDNIKEKMNLAVSGHYQRPDIFDFKINEI